MNSVNTVECTTDTKAGNPHVLFLFNKTELLGQFDGDNDLTQSILEDAVTEIPRYVSELQTLCSGTDIQAIRLQAHSIKGMAANLSTHALQEVSRRIEDAAKNGDLDSVQKLVPELVQTARMTVEAINSI